MLVRVLVGALMWSLLCHQCLLFFCGLNRQFICVVVCWCLCEVVCQSVCSSVCPFVIGLFVSAFTGSFISSKHSCDPEEVPCPFHLPWRYTVAILIVQLTHEALVCDAELSVIDCVMYYIVTLAPFLFNMSVICDTTSSMILNR
jgi:hypothetical protein